MLKTERIFPGTSPACMIPRGELTRPADCGGTTIAKRTVSQARGACPHTWPALSDRHRVFPPTESRLNCWQMTLHPLQLQPRLSSRIALPMTDERRLFLHANDKWTMKAERI